MHKLGFEPRSDAHLKHFAFKFADRKGVPHLVSYVRCTTSKFAFMCVTNAPDQLVLYRFEYLPFCAYVIEEMIRNSERMYLHAMNVVGKLRAVNDAATVETSIQSKISWVVRVLAELTIDLPWATNAAIAPTRQSLDKTIETNARALFGSLSILQWHHEASLRVHATKFVGLPGSRHIPIREILVNMK